MKYPGHWGYEISWKFQERKEVTTLTDIIWTIGAKGNESPVAIFEPVSISGRNIEKATLHNQKRINELQLEIGDIIEVGLAGDVIPKVYSNLSKNITI